MIKRIGCANEKLNADLITRVKGTLTSTDVIGSVLENILFLTPNWVRTSYQ